MIDTKRLATDAAYWRECGAPEDATHYCAAKKEWINGHCHSIDVCCILRPQAEWALPDDGALCVVWDDECNKGHYFLCEFQADGPRFQQYPSGGCFYPDEISGCQDTSIRLPTKAQRDREELIRIIKDSDDMAYSFRPDDIADAILSRYNLEPKS